MRPALDLILSLSKDAATFSRFFIILPKLPLRLYRKETPSVGRGFLWRDGSGRKPYGAR